MAFERFERKRKDHFTHIRRGRYGRRAGRFKKTCHSVKKFLTFPFPVL